MFCMKCGTQLPDDALFCYKCGNKINVASINNEPKDLAEQKQVPVQEKNTYQIGNKIVRFNSEYNVYIQIVKILNQQSKKAVNEFSLLYKNWNSAEASSDKALSSFYSLLQEGFLSCKNIAIQNGVYDYSTSKISEYHWTQIMEPFSSVWRDLRDSINSVNQDQKSDELAREYRKATRFRVVGGGFGIEGAVKGMAIAGAINLTTGAAHSAFNMVGNLFSSLAASSARSDLYNSALAGLQQGIRESFELLLPEIAKIITGKVHVDKKKELTIFKHIKDGSFGDGMDLHNPFADAFQAFPFDEELYLEYIHRFPDEEQKIMTMGKDLGVNLEEIYGDVLHYNGFEFHSILAAEFVRASEEPFFRGIDQLGRLAFTEEWETKLSDRLNNEKMLVEINSREIVEGLIARYSIPLELPTGAEEVQEYRKQRLEFFSNVEPQIVQTCYERPLNLNFGIGRSKTFIAFFLRLCNIVNERYLTTGFGHDWNGKMYIGTDITPEVEKEARDTIWNYKDADDIYLYYHNGKKGTFEIANYIALTSDGIVNQDHSVSYHDLKVEFDKGTLVDDLIVNGKTWSISLVGRNLLWLVTVIQNLQPFCEAVEKYIAYRNEGALKQNPAYLHDIGALYYNGDPRIGLAKDYAKSKFWLQKAASLGENNSLDVIYNAGSYGLDTVEPVSEDIAMLDFGFSVANNIPSEVAVSEDYTTHTESITTDYKEDYSSKFIQLANSFNDDYWKECNEWIEVLDKVNTEDAKKAFISYAYGLPFYIDTSEVKVLVKHPSGAKTGFFMTDSCLICSDKPNVVLALNEIDHLRIDYPSDMFSISVYTEPANIMICSVYGGCKDFINKINELFFGYNPELITFSNNLTPSMVEQGFLSVRNSLNEQDFKELSCVTEKLHVLDTIPEKKARNVVNSYAKDMGIQAADIKFLFDQTLFGNAKEGMVITNQYVLDHRNKKPIPVNHIQYLRLSENESGKVQVYVEPMHILVMRSEGVIPAEKIRQLFDKINQYVFHYSETSGMQSGSAAGPQNTSTTQQYVCPTCGALINYKDPICNSCRTQISWGDDSDTSTTTQETFATQQYECPVCRHLINYKDTICNNCGTQISWD